MHPLGVGRASVFYAKHTDILVWVATSTKKMALQDSTCRSLGLQIQYTHFKDCLWHQFHSPFEVIPKTFDSVFLQAIQTSWCWGGVGRGKWV